MQLIVLTPEKEYFKGEVDSIKAPGVVGEFQILKNHAPIVSELAEGKVTLRETSGKGIEFEIDGGFIEVHNNKVSLLVSGIKEN